MNWDKDLILFIILIGTLACIGMTAFYVNARLDSTTTIKAMELGYCSKAHPNSNTLIVWTKCDDGNTQ